MVRIMELDGLKNRSNGFPGGRRNPVDLTDVTILNTPRPQASSTVDGKHRTNKQMKLTDLTEYELQRGRNDDESSLGIIDNISSLLGDESTLEAVKSNDSKERELARKLLEKCSPSISSSPISRGTGKENNINVSNMTNEKLRVVENDKSVNFEPNEISARSSEVSQKKNANEPCTGGGISFTSTLAGIMAQCEDEEFLSASKQNFSAVDADLWNKDNLFSVPGMSAKEKERLNLSCFSGIIGEVDLSLESGRMSVGEFFRRKCGATGHLDQSSKSINNRPNFGLNIQSPVRHHKRNPLVDESVVSKDLLLTKNNEPMPDDTRNLSLMSLSSIAQVLQEDDITPRKCIDQILNAQKKKKQLKNPINQGISNTYTILPSAKPSLPSCLTDYDTPEKDLPKIDSKMEIINKLSPSKNINGLNPKLKELLNMNLDDTLTGTPKNIIKELCETTPVQKNFGSQKGSPVEMNFLAVPSPLDESKNYSTQLLRDNLVSRNSLLTHSRFGNDIGQSTLNNKSDSKLDLSFRDEIASTQNRSLNQESSNVEIRSKNNQIHTCFIGIPRDADLEIFNKSDRWVLCKVKLQEIQGESENIAIDLPDEEILIEPAGIKLFKIGVLFPRIGKFTIVNLNLHMSDMVTRSHWNMKHLMCFVPEELNIITTLPSNGDYLNFETIMEDTSKTIPITFENKNSTDIPILLKIDQKEPFLFNINLNLDETLTSTQINKDLFETNILLSPKEKVTVNVEFKGMSLRSLGDEALNKELYEMRGNLNVHLCCKENENYALGKIPLIGQIGTCKLEVLGTQFPIHLQPRICRTITLLNSGNINLTAKADMVISKDSQAESRDFSVCPNNIFLKIGEKLEFQIVYKPENHKTDLERHAMIKLSIGNKISFYPVVGERDMESSSESLQRSDTPQYLRPVSAPTSPHSLIFNRSGNSGRHSPGSTISNSTSLPVRATHTALVWSSIKPGKSDLKRFTVRNTSNNKLKLACSITCKDQDFKFLKESQSLGHNMSITLQGMESKSLSVVFSPTSIGASAGKIIFSHSASIKSNQESNNNLVKVIPLYGYGGIGKLEILNTLKDTSGQMWLTLGKLNSEGILRGKVKLHNIGDLSCFVALKIAPQAVHPMALASWHIEPPKLLIKPKSSNVINIEFHPRKDDVVLLRQNNVIHVGTLKATYGDEPTRLRIRRLYNKLKETGQLTDKLEEQADSFKEIVQPICKTFPGEVMIQDLKIIADSTQNFGDLCKQISHQEIKITVEVNPDETSLMIQDTMDESLTLYSLCGDNESRFGGESFLPTD